MEWRKVKISDIADIINGGTPKTSIPKYWDGDIPWLSVKDFNNGLKYVYSSERTITKEGLDNSATNLLQKDDIIISARGTVGVVAMIPSPMAFNQSCFGLHAKNFDAQYLYYLLKIKVRELQSQSQGSVFDTIVRATFDRLECLVPTNIADQRRIAAILSSLDAQIENNNRINANLEAQAQALFKSWFVDFEPWGGAMPEGWKEGKLGEIAQIIMGQSPEGKTLNSNGNGTIFYQGSADFGFRFPSVRIFSTNPTRYAEQNSVLMSVRAPVGDVNVALTTSAIGRGLCSIKALGDYQSFILYLVKSLKPQLDSFNGEGSVFGSINRKSLEEMPVICPSNDVVVEFESKVTPLDAQIRNNTEANARLASLRDTLLPKLMKGEIEV